MNNIIEETDSEKLKLIVKETIRCSVATTEEEAIFLIDDINVSLQKWFSSGLNGYSSKFLVNKSIVGFIIVKEFWNLSHLFVLPAFQQQGIGKSLLAEAIAVCSERSPKGKLLLNSSVVAANFYEALGFKQSGLAHDRPGGCIPYEIVF
ncbi:MAG: GNAT family N-acetyltransferase [Gammaproteobacteria bacterium]|nr:GNAT family N-acetyltransferase [Gammaproteobacteria bacterium]